MIVVVASRGLVTTTIVGAHPREAECAVRQLSQP